MSSMLLERDVESRRLFVELIWQRGYGEVMLNSAFFGFFDMEQSFPLRKIRNAWKEYVGNAQHEDNHMSLYSHIPFCQKKCNYCNLNRWICAGEFQLKNYTQSIVREMRSFHRIFKDVKFKSLYAGGGTPNMLAEKQLEKVLSGIHGNFVFEEQAEKTFECNPCHSTPNKLKILADHGINRISFGVQSLDDEILRHANRGYQNYNMVRKAIDEVRKFPSLGWINADLLIGLWDDTLQTVIASFIKLAQLKIDEMSLYPLAPPPDYLKKYYDNRKDLFDQQLAEKSLGFERIIVPVAKKFGYNFVRTNLSTPGRHTWNFVFQKSLLSKRKTTYNIIDEVPSSCLGIGAGSWSVLSGIARYRKLGAVSFIKNQAVVKSTYEWIPLKGQQDRLFYIAARLSTGKSCLSFSQYKDKFGTDIRSDFKQAFHKFQRLGAVVINGDTVSLTAKTTNERFVSLLFFIDNRAILAGLNKLQDRGKIGGQIGGR